MSRLLPRPSLLLQHIHGSLPALTRLYDEEAAAAAKGRTPSSSSPSHRAKRFPPDPQDAAQGESVMRFFCEELGMGPRALALWRSRSAAAAQQYWGVASSDAVVRPGPVVLPAPIALAASHRAPSSSSSSSTPKQSETDPSPHTAAASTDVPEARLYLQPRQQDVAFMRAAMAQLRLLPSPLVTLSPPPCPLATPTTGAEALCTVEARTQRPHTESSTSRFFASKRIPAGMFVLSLPTEAVLMAQPPPAADPVLSFFLHLDDLVGQLVAAEEEGPSHPHHGYVQYLKDSVVPCRNLPFLSRKAMEKLAGPRDNADPDTTATASSDVKEAPSPPPASLTTTTTSPAWDLWQLFHEEMQGQPLSPYLRERLTPETYAWWASAVLSRRTGAAMLIPVADKLNHHPLPNCYYTMSNEASLCGLDVLDNIIAGVPLDLLYQPYVHLFTIRDVEPGEELTLCYASPEQGHYRPASRQMPAAPDMSKPRRSSPPETLQEAFDSLFSSASGVGGGGTVDELAQSLQSAAHPSTRQEVHTAEGRARWQLQWGFVPLCDAVFSGKDLEEVASIVAERRVDTRSALFPADRKASPPSTTAPSE